MWWWCGGVGIGGEVCGGMLDCLFVVVLRPSNI